MKNVLVLVVLIIGTALSVAAQSNVSSITTTRSAVEAERKELIATNLELSQEHRDVFWPLYLEYRVAVDKIGDDEVEFYERFFSSYETLTDSEALALLDEHFDFQRRHLDVQKTHSQKMRAALPGKIVARFFQIENKMDIIVEYELAGEIPLIK